MPRQKLQASGTVPTYWWGREELPIDRYTAAQERVRFAFDHYDNVVVSFSGGKDSTATLNLALDEARSRGELPLHVQFCDEEGISYQTEDYVRRVAELPEVTLDWYCVPIRHRSAASSETAWWFPWAPEAEHLWIRPMPPEAITAQDIDGYTDPGPDPEGDRPNWPNLSKLVTGRLPGSTAVLMGIRADESLIRRKAVSNNRRENYVIHSTARVDKVYPIYDWTSQDVWTAPKLHGWDYNPSYDLMEASGIPVNSQRLAPPFGDEPIRGLAMWAECFPDIWDRMCYRVPGAATAARYSTTELYAFGELPTKPEGEDWQHFIRRLIDRHEDHNERVLISQEVKEIIRRHYLHTRDPILYTAHPQTSIGWKLLTKIAVRGDHKDRASAFASQGKQEDYDAELAAYRAAQRAERSTVRSTA